MSAVYLAALLGVGVSILWLLVDAVASVSRKPRWETQKFHTLTLVAPAERRAQNLPFVGSDRRQTSAAGGPEEERKVA